MSIPSSPEVEYAETVVLVNSGESLLLQHLRPLREAQHAATLASLTPTEAVLEQAFQAGLTKLYAETNWVEVAPHLQADMRVLLNAASVVLLADKEREIERLKGERDKATTEWSLHRISLAATAAEGARLRARVTALEAEAQKLREALTELRGFFGVKAECRVPEQAARDIVDKALGGSK